MTAAGIVNAMTVDVEEHFQVSAFAATVSRDEWDSMPSRVERNTDRLLELFASKGAKSTFFTLGCVAERYPALVRRIADAGHEVASHGYAHHRVTDHAPEEFREDIRRTRGILQDLSGQPVLGYRAASFSIDGRTPWAHEILAEEGYLYSSSIYPVKHDHYGVPDAPRFAYRPDGDNGTRELPMTTVRLMGRNFPGSGGGFFRLLPYAISRWAVSRVNRTDAAPAIFYLHPWEIDPDQPRPGGLSAKTRFRHYVNLNRTHDRLSALLSDFRWDRMDRVFDVAE